MPGDQRHYRRSSSSEPEIKYKKHKHSDRPRSPGRGKERERHRRKREDQQSPVRRSDHEHHRGHNHDNRRHRPHDDHSRVKQEPPDRGYERWADSGENRQEQQQRERAAHDQQRRERRRKNNQEGNPFTATSRDREQYGVNMGQANPGVESTQPKEEPNFETSGKLTEETNTYRGVVIKYNEPPEARKPKKKWRLYPFKGDEALPLLHLHRASAYLMGRDRKVVDIPVDHPSCSKQHAVLQFRLVPFYREDGTKGRRVRPYIIDLGSSNGTYLNNTQIEAERYVEIMEKDVLKFGYSSREYVLLHDKTDTSELNDDEDVADSE